ncbi:hypothetical protein B4V02_12800 [Paenibacillus kribbensis]|uniref:Beta-xylosidase C-terminal Concanavalin A-like domain-containing protein n=1 Tax=Paenibacillus kribbensis TaxID=172713 RepID=A0A222WNB2_9BACL|nr:hypothetical protein B4V02_12800 [Paenibacillus kribbensis]
MEYAPYPSGYQLVDLKREKRVFALESFQQMTGLILYYDTEDYVYLRITHVEEQGRVLGIIQTIRGNYDELLAQDLSLPSSGPIRLKAAVCRDCLHFFYALGGSDWQSIGVKINILHLADEASDLLRFTGTFVGVCVQDLGGTRRHADFDYFIYREIAPK